ncbi:MAG: hypothetical protein KGM99_05020 [Burkholderiales bacterium]|nr:hypothetical protein [Burkholderiales bacterium]
MPTALKEFVQLLSCNALDESEQDDIVRQIVNAPDDPEFEWADSPEQARLFALTFALGEYMATGDKLDELHEQVQRLFDDDFPEIPAPTLDDMENGGGAIAYFEWLETEFCQYSAEEGGYDLVELDMMGSDMNAIVVYRKDTPRVLELAKQLDFKMQRPLDYFRDLLQPHRHQHA